jgi:hypothetical protein
MPLIVVVGLYLTIVGLAAFRDWQVYRPIMQKLAPGVRVRETLGWALPLVLAAGLACLHLLGDPLAARNSLNLVSIRRSRRHAELEHRQHHH